MYTHMNVHYTAVRPVDKSPCQGHKLALTQYDCQHAFENYFPAMIFEYETAIKNGLVHWWSLEIKIYMIYF